MKNYAYQNILIDKKQLRKLLSWSFTNYDSSQASNLADTLKNLGFKYASQAGISLTIEDLKVPFSKNFVIKKANQKNLDTEKINLSGKISDIERFQKIIDTWNITSEALKEHVISFFKNYDPLNSLYIMAFSGARGNLSQVRQLVGMRGLMSDPSGQIMNLAIKKNFKEGLSITDYLISSYGARKGIIDTALKTADSGYLTRRLIDVGQDIFIREKDCFTTQFLFTRLKNVKSNKKNQIYQKLIGQVLGKPIFDKNTNKIILRSNSQINRPLIKNIKKNRIEEFYFRSPLTCKSYRSICQKCYGWDLSKENIVDLGEAVGILAGQSIGEPGTQLTMRTFHTGGVFTTKLRQQLISPFSGIVKFHKNLKTILLRTNKGEDVLITKNSAPILLIPENPTQKIIPLKVYRNTILFLKHNQYVGKGSIFGELLNSTNSLKSETKQVLVDQSGEICVPKLRTKNNTGSANKVIWVLYGQLYKAPKNSFINFYFDRKLNKKSYVFRTKTVHHFEGTGSYSLETSNRTKNFITLNRLKYSIKDTAFASFQSNPKFTNFLLAFNRNKYLIYTKSIRSRLYLRYNKNRNVGKWLTPFFKTVAGGILFYDFRIKTSSKNRNSKISYYRNKNRLRFFTIYRSIVWIDEKNKKKQAESENNIFKVGLTLKEKKLKKCINRIYFPGEIIHSKIYNNKLSVIELIPQSKNYKILLKSFIVYELACHDFDKPFNSANLELKLKLDYVFKPNQKIKSQTNLTLVLGALQLNYNKKSISNPCFELIYNKKKATLDFKTKEKISLKNYVPQSIIYKEINNCVLFQPQQFLDKYTIFNYLEVLTKNSLEIAKFKEKNDYIKHLLLVSNKNCSKIKKFEYTHKKLNDFIINNKNAKEAGQIIAVTNNHFIIQKGQPYFFPNCKSIDNLEAGPLKYKIFFSDKVFNKSQTKRIIYLNYKNELKFSFSNYANNVKDSTNKKSLNIKFCKLFVKKNGKLYSSKIPQFIRKFFITVNKKTKPDSVILPEILVQKDRVKAIMFKNSTCKKADSKKETTSYNEFFLAYLIKYAKAKPALYSINNAFFERDINYVFCKNNEFIEENKIIGLLTFEKEITGDIVQGLPQIQKILEARKENLIKDKMRINSKKSFLIQKTSLDPSFQFAKLGASTKENKTINPHRLLKTWFNYYGLVKQFPCYRTKTIKFNRLFSNFEGSFKSFKKVQLLLLSLVQSIYKSQGIFINDKHIELIIKQMTSKVLITHKGDTPLDSKETIDLYHINYINKISKRHKKTMARFIPVLLGITQASLNSPSFISSASFQEATKIIKKAAIEGKIDWLRGLKENVIISSLIPTGTGSTKFRNCFNKFRSYN